MDNNTIKDNGEVVKMVDEEYPNKGCWIVNTDVSSGGGTHYIVLYIKNNECYIIDPLGKNNFRPYDNIMMEKLQNYDVSFYPYKFQMDRSVHCGWFSLYVCKLIKYLKYPDINKLTKELVRIFGKTADVADELQLVKAFGVQKKM